MFPEMLVEFYRSSLLRLAELLGRLT